MMKREPSAAHRTTISTGGASTTTSTSKSKRQQQSKPKNLRTAKSVLWGRLLFVFVLMIVATVLGYLSYHLMSESERQLAEERFVSIAERALDVAQITFEEKKLTTDSLAHVAAAANPNKESWPNVYIEGYEEIATSLRLVTEGQGISFCPIVKAGGEEQASFEAFAYDLFYNVRNMPNHTGVSDFGRGIYAYDWRPENPYEDKRRPETSGWTYYDSPNDDILVPFIQSDLGFHTALMLNVHFEEERGNTIDRVLACSKERAAEVQEAGGDVSSLKECGSITNLMWSPTNHDVDPGPASIMFVPIYPKFDNTTITGFIVAKTIMHDMLKHGFAPDVDGLHAVLHTPTTAHTYEILGGEAHYVGEGDLHDTNAVYHQGAVINPRYFSENNDTPIYTLDLYSTIEFETLYTTNNPMTACIGAVAIIVVTSLLFFCYDFFVRKEFHSKKSLLESKRQFVRFVSHEVRTPLNTVCMGLSLLQDDFAKGLGLKKNNNKHNTNTRNKHNNDNNNKGNGQNGQQRGRGDGGGGGSDTTTVTTTTTDQEQFEDWMQLSTQIQRNAEAAVSVLNDLLNYDKIQMGTLTLELSLIPIWTTIQKTVAEFQIASLEKRVKLSIDFSPMMMTTMDENGGNTTTTTTATTPNNKNGGVIIDCDSIQCLPIEKRGYKMVADNIRIAQVLRNLISNGLKFSSENGTLTVRVSQQQEQSRRHKKANNNKDTVENIELHDGNVVALHNLGMVVIEVIDDGIGMTPDQVKTVFQDGTQFNANKFQAGGGSGLGLNIAKGIATEHGGSLKCYSSGIGKGTTFTLSVPMYEKVVVDKMKGAAGGGGGAAGVVSETAKDVDFSSAAEEVNSSSSSEDADGFSDTFQIQDLDILVVDDSTTNRKLCMRLLEKQGHTCKGACDGVEAVQMAKVALERNEPFDCILLDYEMPNMTGPEACKLIREMGCWSYIVGVTGNVMGEDVALFRECGANWVLPKPFRLEALEQKWIEDGVSPRKQDPEHSDQFLVGLDPELDPDTSAKLRVEMPSSATVPAMS